MHKIELFFIYEVDMNGIIDLKADVKVGTLQEGVVYLNEAASVRVGKNNNSYLTGNFFYDASYFEFKVWESRLFDTLVSNGAGLYYCQIEKSVFNGNSYFTVKNIVPYHGADFSKSDFLPRLDKTYLMNLKNSAYEEARKYGVSEACIQLTEELLNEDELAGRFWTEGAAVKHHDNICGGLANHSLKMLKIGLRLMDIYPELKEHGDLFFMGIMLHDIGKVYEYTDLSMSRYWYANHRVRGIEFLASRRAKIEKIYNETFYRQIQAIIQGHHGEFQDRPTTVATLIVHFIDSIESQVTGLLQRMKEEGENKLYVRDIGYLAGFEDSKSYQE